MIIITPRLLYGIQLHTAPGPSWISVDPGKPYNKLGRQQVAYFIDTPEWEYKNDDLSGIGSVAEHIDSLLSFLQHSAEAYRYAMSGREVEDADLFPPHVVEWAYQNEEELGSAQIELQENLGE